MWIKPVFRFRLQLRSELPRRGVRVEQPKFWLWQPSRLTATHPWPSYCNIFKKRKGIIRNQVQYASALCAVTKEMGVNAWAAFAGTDDDAVVDGDFAVLEDELQIVLKALRRSGVNIVAIHQHTSQKEPRILFLRYWGPCKTSDLARAARTALANQTK